MILSVAQPTEGSDAVGPYRQNFQEALRELQELRALQQLRGDQVLCQVAWAQTGGGNGNGIPWGYQKPIKNPKKRQCLKGEHHYYPVDLDGFRGTLLFCLMFRQMVEHLGLILWLDVIVGSKLIF